MNNIVTDLKEIDLKPIEFLGHRESLIKLRVILGDTVIALNKLIRPDSGCLINNVFIVALKAQFKVLEYLNDQHLNCSIPWDKRTGLPSHPSMIADAQKYTKFFQCSEGLKSVLDSLLGWSFFAKEELLCCCGGSLLKPRNVSFDVMLNHSFRIDYTDDNFYLVVKQLVGIRCSNKGHLKNHYNFGKMSRVTDDLSMILISEGGLRKYHEEIFSRFYLTQKADQFNLEEFSRRIASIADEI